LGLWIGPNSPFFLSDQYAHYDGFVVLHGSDTMSYTASAMSFMLQRLSKPVIFTGSQLPIGDMRTDAKENLITSIELASLQEEGIPIINEVAIYFEYKLYRANRTTKMNADNFEAFWSPNYPILAEAGVRLQVFKDRLLPRSHFPFELFRTLDQNVSILKIYPGITAQHILTFSKINHLKAIILETYGAGNVPSDSSFLNALEKLIASGVFVINITQCMGGEVTMGHYKSSEALLEMGVVSGKDMTTEAALAKTMHLLPLFSEGSEFKKAFENNLSGEQS
jgi:L-asparaginase